MPAPLSRRWLLARGLPLLLALAVVAPGCGRATYVLVTVTRRQMLILPEFLLTVKVRAAGGGESVLNVTFPGGKTATSFSLQLPPDYGGSTVIEVSGTPAVARPLTGSKTVEVKAGADTAVTIDID